jgi:hypothetical protein
MPHRARVRLVGVPQHQLQHGNNRVACFFVEEGNRIYLHRFEEGVTK